MTSDSSGHVDPAVLLAQAGWLRVLDDIHGGLCHDFNGRVSSLDGLFQILQMDGDDGTLLSHLEEECTRLADVVRVMRSLAGTVDREAEPLQATHLFSDACALHERHRGLEKQEIHVSVADGVPPFRACGPRLLRVLLILMSRAALAGLDQGVRELELSAVESAGSVVMSVSWHSDADAWATETLEPVAGYLDGALALDGGQLVLGAGRVGMSLPAMGQQS